VSRQEASSGNAGPADNQGQGTAPPQAGGGNNNNTSLSSITPLSSMDEARAAAIALGPIELEQDSSARPLKEALIDAQARFQEKAQLREALEAEAQEVAQLAVEAGEKKEKTQEQVMELVQIIEESTRLQQQHAETVARLQERLLEAEDPGLQAQLHEEMNKNEELMEEMSEQVTTVRLQLEELYAKAVVAETSTIKADSIAAAAMKAAETAVMEEMQAAAVVKETHQALEKALSQLSTLSSAEQKAQAVAAMKEGMTPQQADQLALAMSSKESKGTKEAKATKEADPIKSKAEAEAAAAKKRGEQMAMAAKVGFVAVLAACAWWALQNTTPGLQLVGWGQEMYHVAAEKLGHIHIHEGEKGVIEAIWLLFSSIICVPLVVKLVPGGNPVLGYLLGGAIVGPHALGLIQDVQSVKHLAELGVVFLLFNIGLELSLDRLQSMAKYVFGLGSAQVALTLLGIAGAAVCITTLSGPSAIILGGSLALSSTAVAIQVLEDRGEMGSRHGRVTFSVLLLQDLAVVVLLMLIPLLAPSPDGSQSGGLAKIAQALGVAAIKACVCIVGIITCGRALLQPIYKQMSSFANAEIFAATTLLVVLGTSVLTSLAGLSLALGAFLAGLLIAETEFALQVESDIAPYKGLLLGLFFMSVGMEISAQLFLQKWKEVIAAIVVLIVGKVAVMAGAGPLFGVPRLASIRSGLLLAPGGEFAFVAFGEAVQRGVLPAALTNQLYLVVALSMALTPYLAALGAKMGATLERQDVKAMQPHEEETKELHDHVIIAGYGRAGQLIGQLLSENLIPFVALDVSNERVAAGKAQDLPIYFGDAGSPAVLHKVAAERAACAVIALDSPGSNYRAVWAMTKHFPHVKTYVRAHDVNHALNLEKAGATAVVPEILEPSLQLAAAVLTRLDWNGDEVMSLINDFRRKHLAELQALTAISGTSLGLGFVREDQAEKEKKDRMEKGKKKEEMKQKEKEKEKKKKEEEKEQGGEVVPVDWAAISS